MNVNNNYIHKRLYQLFEIFIILPTVLEVVVELVDIIP